MRFDRQILLVAACIAFLFGVSMTSLAADSLSPSQALAQGLTFSPVQSQVEYTIPNKEDAQKCTIQPEKEAKGTAWIVRNERGQVLRRFADTNNDNVVDLWCYYLDGIEVYRDRPRDSWRVMNGEVMMATDPLDLRELHDEPGAERAWAGLERNTTIGHVHLHVPHLDTAEAFYCGRVGFQPMLRGYPGALFVAAGGYHHHLGLNTWTGIGAPPPPEHAVGLRSFTIESAGVEPAAMADPNTRVTVLMSRKATTEDTEDTE